MPLMFQEHLWSGSKSHRPQSLESHHPGSGCWMPGVQWTVPCWSFPSLTSSSTWPVGQAAAPFQASCLSNWTRLVTSSCLIGPWMEQDQAASTRRSVSNLHNMVWQPWTWSLLQVWGVLVSWCLISSSILLFTLHDWKNPFPFCNGFAFVQKQNKKYLNWVTV